MEKNKGNKLLISILIIMFLVIVGLVVYILMDKKDNKEKNEDKEKVEDEVVQEEKYTSYKKGDSINLSDGSEWLVLQDSDEKSDYVVVLSNEDYANSITRDDIYFDLFNEISTNTTNYENSKLKEYLESKQSEIPVELKEVDGSKIRLITIDEIFNFDNNWEYSNENDTYYYKGTNINTNFIGILTMSHTKCSEGKCTAFYNLSQTECYTEDCKKETFLSHWMQGLGGIKPVINVYKESITE